MAEAVQPMWPTIGGCPGQMAVKLWPGSLETRMECTFSFRRVGNDYTISSANPECVS